LAPHGGNRGTADTVTIGALSAPRRTTPFRRALNMALVPPENKIRRDSGCHLHRMGEDGGKDRQLG